MNRVLLAAAMLSASMPLVGGGVEVLSSPPRDPPRPRTVRDKLIGKQRKRERIARAKLKASGISGAKLWRKAAAGKL